MAGKFYAVKEGRDKGIFKTWAECSKSVKGWHNACFKSFTNEEDAENFINAGTNIKISDDAVQIYTDGSGKGGYGVVIFLKGKKYTAYGKIPFETTSQGAELYAIIIALSLIRNTDCVINTDSQYSMNNLVSYRKHTNGVSGKNGQASFVDKSIPNYNLLTKIDKLMENRNVVFHHVDAHSTVELNNECDSLARLGASGKKNFILTCDGKIVM